MPSTGTHDPTAGARSLHARRTAAAARAAVGVSGLVVLCAEGTQLHPHPLLAGAGLLIVVVTAVIQWLAPAREWLAIEEAAASSATVLIVGVGGQHVDVLSLLWVCAAVSGVVARGGRAHWAGRAVLVFGLLLPVLRYGTIELAYAAFVVGAIGLLLTSGRVTRELKEMLRQARHDADHDRLTGVLSSRAVRDRLAARLSRGDALRLLLVDLDEFGAINKARGHAEGDRHLASAAGRIASVLDDADLIGRLGGDEFVIASTTDPPIDGKTLLTALRDDRRDGLGPIRASIGIAHGPRDGGDADATLRAADIALRVAKRRGKNQPVVYSGDELTDDPTTGARGALARLIMGEGLGIAVQPIVDIREHRVFAYEALARFRTRGTPQSPLHWFALADEFGLRDELELAAARAALKLFDQLPAGTRLSVNISPKLLDDDRLIELLDERPRLDGLILEITEDALVQDDAALLASLLPIAARGITLAIDDVGAGYAGLAQMAALRPGLVKLDRRLIQGVAASSHRAALVEALVGYARRTGAQLVAEGVETASELDVVSSLGIDLVQGFLFARPAEPWPEPTWNHPPVPDPGADAVPQLANAHAPLRKLAGADAADT